MTGRVLRCCWLVLLVGMPATARYAVAAEPISVQAGSVAYEGAGEVLHAKGNVKIDWAENTLRAGEIRLEQQQRHLLASGGLSLETPELRLRATSCELDLDTETGVLRDVDVALKQQRGRFGGSMVEKHLGRKFTLSDGYYTTCKHSGGERPAWELTGKRVDVELQGYGRLRDGTFRIKGVPVLYIPYMIFPTMDRRRTGLLTPRLGYSDRRGLIYAQPVFWAIDKHTDATVTPNIETSARLGLNVEYRYRPRRGTDGEVELAYFNEQIRGDSRRALVSPLFEDRSVPQNRGMLRARHRERFGQHLMLYTDVLAVTDDLFFRDVDSVESGFISRALRRSRRYTDSRMGLLGHSGSSSYGLQLSAYQDFVGADRFTVQQPGHAWAVHDGQAAGWIYKIQGTLDGFARRRGADGERLDLAATLERPLRLKGPVRTRVWGRGRFTGYRMEDRSLLDASGALLRRLGRYPSRGIFEGGMDARTALLRTYTLHGDSWKALEHRIEPFASFRYTSDARQDDLPIYDTVDRIDGRRVATYGAASRFLLTRKKDAKTLELARLSVTQSYNLDDEVLDDRFSDIDFSVALRPLAGVSIRSLASYNVGGAVLTGAVNSVSLKGIPLPLWRGPRLDLDAVYRFVRGNVLETAEGRAALRLTERIDVGFNGRYDFVSDRFVEKGAGARWESACGCWAVDAGFVTRVNPDEVQFRLQIELTGLGNLGRSALRYRTPGLSGLNYGDTTFWRPGW